MPADLPPTEPEGESNVRDIAALQGQILGLEQRILRFAVVEQALIDLRAELDDERVQIGRIHHFCRRLFNAREDDSFDGIVADSVVDVFEQQFGLFWRLPAPGVVGPSPSQLACAGMAPPSAEWLQWLHGLIAAGQQRDAVVRPEELRQQPQTLAGHLAVAFCRDQEQRPVAVIVTGVCADRLPFHHLLGAERLTSLSMFAQKVSVLMMMRFFGARIAEQALEVRRSQEQLHLALEAGNVGSWDRDLSTDLIEFSRIGSSLLGYAHGELSGSHQEWLKHVHPEDLDHCLELENMHLRGETDHYENTFRLRHREGHYLWVLARGKVLRDSAGNPLRFFGTLVDVTKQKTIEECLREAEDLERNARQNAESATRAKSAFVASMSHEIRTPMNGVLGMLQVLRGTPLNENQAGLVATAERSALSLLDLIGDILDLSKVEAGKLEIHPEPFAWKPLLEEVAQIMRLRAEAKDIHLSVEIHRAPPPWLVGDALRLRQILTNLINNAIKFTDSGGVTVVLDSCPMQDGGNRHRLQWRVEDTGIGISPASMQRLFKPFSQVDDSSENYRGGTGLGLSISQSLARLMGGEIHASSVLGQGSCFEVILPMPACDGPHEPQALLVDLPAPRQAHFGGKLLVVDDSPVGRMVAKLLLEQLGFEVTMAEGGQQALDALQGGGFRLVFMDCQMPGIDGCETTRRLRQRELDQGLERMPVLALTANVQPSEIADCIRSGMDGYLSKPVTRSALVSALHQHLPAQAANSASSGAIG